MEHRRRARVFSPIRHVAQVGAAAYESLDAEVTQPQQNLVIWNLAIQTWV